MPTGAVNESVFENAVIEVMKKTGWEHVYGPDLKGRDYREPVCIDAFRHMVHKLNRDTPNEAIDAAINKVLEIAGGSLVERNRIFTDYLQNGVESTCECCGEERTFVVDLVDFAHPDRNLFEVLNQWTVIRQCELWVDETPMV